MMTLTFSQPLATAIFFNLEINITGTLDTGSKTLEGEIFLKGFNKNVANLGRSPFNFQASLSSLLAKYLFLKLTLLTPPKRILTTTFGR